MSGSGVATTVTLGSVTWPLLRKAGYPKESGGGVLAASGIGAILSPPTLGAAAFIIAEFLEESYFKVLLYATVPSLLYYLGVLLAIEADARRFRVQGIALDTPGFWRLLGRWGYHFSSLIAIVVLLAMGMSPFRAVLYATVVAFLMSFLDRRDWMGPREVGGALVTGARGVLPIAATCAAAGIIVAVVSLTGLGLELSGLIVDAAGDSLALTAIFSAIAVLILGLAVPVTASFIIAAVIIAPALIALEVEPFVAYMFIFYYAVLSEVSPPTALSAFAAAAITGGDGFKTMMLTARYTLPAFLVPFAFTLTDNGQGLLLQGGLETILLAAAVSAVAVAGLAVALGGWLRGPVAMPIRVLAGAGSIVLLYLEPLWIGIGLALLAVALVAQLVLSRGGPHPAARTTVRDALDSRADRADRRRRDTPRLDAEVLLAAAMGVDRAVLISDPERGVEPEPFREYVQRRAQREPVAYILGRKGFRRLELEVDPRVLIPRPGDRARGGGGAGAAARAPGWSTSAPAPARSRWRWPTSGRTCAWWATDVSAGRAGRRARERRAARAWPSSSSRATCSSRSRGRSTRSSRNPPYVLAGARLAPEIGRYEPAVALYAGADGLEVYRRLVPALRDVPFVAFEVAGMGQAEDVAELLPTGFERSRSCRDLAGIDRVVVGRR